MMSGYCNLFVLCPLFLLEIRRRCSLMCVKVALYFAVVLSGADSMIGTRE